MMREGGGGVYIGSLVALYRTKETDELTLSSYPH